jgi:hypothetical protein
VDEGDRPRAAGVTTERDKDKIFVAGIRDALVQTRRYQHDVTRSDELGTVTDLHSALPGQDDVALGRAFNPV